MTTLQSHSALILRRLYPHVLHLVFAQLSLRDLVQAHATCRVWRSEVATMPERYAIARPRHAFRIDGPLGSEATSLFLRSDLRRHVDSIYFVNPMGKPRGVLFDFLATSRTLRDVEFFATESHRLLWGLSCIRGLRSLTIRCTTIARRDCVSIVSVIDADCLTSLDIQTNSFSLYDMQTMVFVALSRSARRLQRLTIQPCGLNVAHRRHTHHTHSLASFVAGSKELRTLNLRIAPGWGCTGNCWNTQLVLEGVARSTSLTELDMSRLFIGPDEASLLGRALAQPGCAIVALRLHHCNLTDAAIETIASGIGKQQQRTCIEHVDVSDNDFGDVGTLALCTALAATCPHLHVLRLHNIDFSSVAAVNALSDTIRNCALHTLLINGNTEVGMDDFVPTLCGVLSLPEKRHLIRRIGMSGRIIDNVDTLALTSMMELCTELTRVNITDNEIGNDGAAVIAHMLRYHPSIVEFDMCTTFGDHQLDAESIWTLATAWTCNPYATKTLTLSAPIDASNCHVRSMKQLEQSAVDAGKKIRFVTSDDYDDLSTDNDD